MQQVEEFRPVEGPRRYPVGLQVGLDPVGVALGVVYRPLIEHSRESPPSQSGEQADCLGLPGADHQEAELERRDRQRGLAECLFLGLAELADRLGLVVVAVVLGGVGGLLAVVCLVGE